MVVEDSVDAGVVATVEVFGEPCTCRFVTGGFGLLWVGIDRYLGVAAIVHDEFRIPPAVAECLEVPNRLVGDEEVVGPPLDEQRWHVEFVHLVIRRACSEECL